MNVEDRLSKLEGELDSFLLQSQKLEKKFDMIVNCIDALQKSSSKFAEVLATLVVSNSKLEERITSNENKLTHFNNALSSHQSLINELKDQVSKQVKQLDFFDQISSEIKSRFHNHGALINDANEQINAYKNLAMGSQLSNASILEDQKKDIANVVRLVNINNDVVTKFVNELSKKIDDNFSNISSIKSYFESVKEEFNCQLVSISQHKEKQEQLLRNSIENTKTHIKNTLEDAVTNTRSISDFKDKVLSGHAKINDSVTLAMMDMKNLSMKFENIERLESILERKIENIFLLLKKYELKDK